LIHGPCALAATGEKLASMNTNQRTFARLAAQGATFVDAYD
jgi:hypothetical protein